MPAFLVQSVIRAPRIYVVKTDQPALLNPDVQAILVEQAAIEEALVEIIDLPPNSPALLAFRERLHAQARRCIDFAQRVKWALSAGLN